MHEESHGVARQGHERLLHDFFEAAAARWPDRVAIDVPPGEGRPRRKRTTYRDLRCQANRIACFLHGLVREDSVVAIMLPRGAEQLYAAQLGALKAGAAYTCIDPSFPDERCSVILHSSEAVVLLTDDAGRQRRGGLGIDPERVRTVDDVLRQTPPGAEPPDVPWLSPTNLAYLIYTSGTSGKPKGVMIEHRAICNLVAGNIECFGLTPEDRVTQSSSASWDSSVEEVWLPLAAGATLVVMDEATVRSGPDIIPWLRAERISMYISVPTQLRSTGCTDPAAELPDLRYLYVGGEALARETAEIWSRACRLFNGYGPTETAVVSVRSEVLPGREVTIGHPVPGMYAWVLDDSLREVSDGSAGELCIGGIGLARGYHRSPKLTEEKFPLHPEFGRVYRTGDLVRRDERGEYVYLGRIDSQVKLRGYRIELEEIESHLAACPGVRLAACCVQGRGAERHLAAFVVCQDADAPPSFDEIEARLREAVPSHMVPSRFALLSSLPTNLAGKLDRQALPEIGMPERRADRDLVAPRNETEAAIAEVFRSALGLEGGVSIHEDFFNDLGGDSLAAAVAISELRHAERTAGLTVRDLYDARSVGELATRVRVSDAAPAPAADQAVRPEGNRSLAGAVQGAWLLVSLLLGGWAAYVASFVLLPILLRNLGPIGSILALPALGSLLVTAYAPLSVLLASAAKKLLIGRYRETAVPVWSGLYVRNWMVQQAVRLIPWGLLGGTVFQSWALRMLGARVGKRVHIHRGVNLLQGGWDLLDIGDDVTICQDAAVRLVDIRDRQLVVAPVRIGSGATIDIRAGVSGGSVVGDSALLTAMSWLRYGERIPDGERWDGIPAGPAGAAPDAPSLAGEDRPWSPVRHGVALIAARVGVGVLSSAPLVVLLLGLAMASGLDGEGILAWLWSPSFSAWLGPLIVAAVVFTPVSLLVQAVIMRLLGAIRPGVISRWSPAYIRIWLKAGILAGASEWLSGTLYWPVWLRLAGMKIGRNCEISTIIDVPPECVEVGDESFFADGIYLGCPRVHRGAVTVARTTLGKNTFIGNHAIIHTGQRLPDDLLIGVCTVADDRAFRQDSSWFGHPPFELPRGGPVSEDRSVTHDPSLVRYVTRLFWETLRFGLPVVSLLALLVWFKALKAALGSMSGMLYLLVIVPGLLCALSLAFCLLVLVIKWGLLGRVKPGRHPFWCCWCSRWDFLYIAWNYLARRILAAFEGTPFIHGYLRAMGIKIGRGVVLGGSFAQVVDPDMLEFADGATVNNHFQAHSFEDRMLKIDRVKIGPGATVNGGAVLFYATDIGRLAWVGPHSVVMKQERLLPGRCYVGCPTEEAPNVGR